MRVRRIAVLIDGGFFVKKLKRIVGESNCDSAEKVASCATSLCRRHVQRLIHEDFSKARKKSQWLDHGYRLFYYDAVPYEGTAHFRHRPNPVHPVLQRSRLREKVAV